MEKVKEIKALENYKLYLKYEDGVDGIIDLSDIAGKGVFKAFLDVNFFNNVWIGESGAPTWENELDIDPINTYLTITGISFEKFLIKEKENANH
jgi:hypothetical protein